MLRLVLNYFVFGKPTSTYKFHFTYTHASPRQRQTSNCDAQSATSKRSRQSPTRACPPRITTKRATGFVRPARDASAFFRSKLAVRVHASPPFTVRRMCCMAAAFTATSLCTRMLSSTEHCSKILRAPAHFAPSCATASGLSATTIASLSMASQCSMVSSTNFDG